MANTSSCLLPFSFTHLACHLPFSKATILLAPAPSFTALFPNASTKFKCLFSLQLLTWLPVHLSFVNMCSSWKSFCLCFLHLLCFPSYWTCNCDHYYIVFGNTFFPVDIVFNKINWDIDYKFMYFTNHSL